MKLPRRRFVGLAADVAALPVTSWIAEAQAYPTRSITMSDGVRRDSLRMGPEPSRSIPAFCRCEPTFGLLIWQRRPVCWSPKNKTSRIVPSRDHKHLIDD